MEKQALAWKMIAPVHTFFLESLVNIQPDCQIYDSINLPDFQDDSSPTCSTSVDLSAYQCMTNDEIERIIEAETKNLQQRIQIS